MGGDLSGDFGGNFGSAPVPVSQDRFRLTFSELLFAVLLGHLDHEDLVFTDVGCHPGQALSARAADTDQQHVAPWLADDTHCPRD